MSVEQNPYAPPKASVEDIGTAAGEILPCPDVELACKLCWLSFGVGVIDKIVEMFRLAGSASMASQSIEFIIALAFGFLITWWITHKLRAGRNWMRWLITILNVVSVLVIVLLWNFFALSFRAYAQDLPTAIFAGLQMLIGGAALVLLFTRASRDWFDEWSNV